MKKTVIIGGVAGGASCAARDSGDWMKMLRYSFWNGVSIFPMQTVVYLTT